MSHHLDSPLARQDPRLDITDLYVFRGQHGMVLITNHNHSLADSSLLRGLHPEGRYEFKVDVNGDAVEELTYRFVFSPCDNRGRQTFCLSRLSGSEAAEPTADGVVIGRGITGEPADVIALFTQLDDELADQLKTNVPADDRCLHADRIARMVAGVIRANGTALDPDAYAWRVVEQILPNILPYAIGSPASYGSPAGTAVR
jgi:hypothetical protein